MYESNGKQNRVLAVCSAGAVEDNVKDIILSIARSAEEYGFKAVFLNAATDLSKHTASSKGEASVFELADNPLFDALIIIPESIKDDEVSYRIIETAKKNDLPVISIDRKIDGCYCVMFNYADSFEDVVRHVIKDHGCRRINFIAGMKDNPYSDERVERFKKELEENGIEFDESRLGYGYFWDEPTRELVEGWLASGQEIPEAVICANDMMAIAACKVLKEHGYRVPEDVIVTGFDGIELEKYNSPRLTTCAVDVNEAGKAAIETAAKLFEGREAPRLTEIPYKMRISQSCGCEPVDFNIVADKIMSMNREKLVDDSHEDYMFTYLTRAIACKEINKLAETMRRYCDTPAWCCINSDYLRDRRSRKHKGCFSDDMILMMSTEVEHSGWMKPFPTKELVPDLTAVLDRFRQIMFYPLHYESEIIGYLAFVLYYGYPAFKNKRRFLMLTNQIIEGFKNRKLIALANEKLAEMHIHDPLTGLLNRRGFYQSAARLIRKLNRTGGRAVIFSVDMDGLKDINDNYGHNEGDKAIKAVANALLKCAGKDDIVSRFGGDEFTVMSEDDDGEYVESFGDRVTTALNEFCRRARLVYPVVVSVGYLGSRFSTVEGLDECIRLADEKMYEQKRSHKRQSPR